ncbi:DUF559 domain-containing protein [Glaciihabitans sp. UYNi722]|uniref:endonuclease domain-containing protein n=1 Tax=Glaciihabitans sp. UYNi722 TaxID=3156344 RepID=UPI003398C431
MRRYVSIQLLVRALGGVAARSQILDAGFSPSSISRALKDSVLMRVRRAWYAVPDAEPDRMRAVMLGGRLGAFSAAQSYGIWRGLDSDLHVSWKPHGNVAKPGRVKFEFPDSQHLSSGRRIMSHWRLGDFQAAAFQATDFPWRESVQQSLAQIFLRANWVDAICACDSAINRGLLDVFEIHELFARLPRRLRRLQRLVDGRAASGLETIVRLWLRETAGYDPRLQVTIGRHTVDLLVGSSLIIETDGQETHSDDERFNEDRVRTAELQARGYTVIRLSYRMIMHNWPLVEEVIRTNLERGRHLDPVR